MWTGWHPLLRDGVNSTMTAWEHTVEDDAANVVAEPDIGDRESGDIGQEGGHPESTQRPSRNDDSACVILWPGFGNRVVRDEFNEKIV